MQVRLTLRERNQERTRSEIAAASLRLFARRGFEAVTVDEIAAAAGVSRRTFFRYFETKEDALLVDDATRLDQLREALQERPADEAPFDSVRGAILALAGCYDTASAAFRLRAEVVVTTPAVHARALEHQAAWEATLREFAAARLGQPESALGPHLLAATCLASLRAALMTWLRAEGDADLMALATEALDRVATGFRAPG